MSRPASELRTVPIEKTISGTCSTALKNTKMQWHFNRCSAVSYSTGLTINSVCARLTASAISRATLSTIFFECAAICKLGLEGIVSKKLTCIYRWGPSRAWLRIKNPKAPAATRAAEHSELAKVIEPNSDHEIRAQGDSY